MGAHAHLALALILIVLGVGYWVLIQANKQDDATLKKVGTVLGYFIIVVAFLVALLTIYHAIRSHGDGYGGKHGGYGMMMRHGEMGQMKGMMMPGHMHPDSLGGTMDHDDQPADEE